MLVFRYDKSFDGLLSALFDAFALDGELTTEHILNSIKSTVPLSKTMSDDLDHLRGWADGRARPATPREAVVKRSHGKLEL